MKKATADDNDLDLGDPETKKKGARGKTKVAATAPMPGQSSSGPQSVPGNLPLPVPPSSKPSEPNITYDWVRSKETVSYDWVSGEHLGLLE